MEENVPRSEEELPPGPQAVVSWSIILMTANTATGLKLTRRIMAAIMLPARAMWLVPWEAGEGRQQLRFCTPCPGDPHDPRSSVGEMLHAAGRIASTWTIMLPAATSSGGPDILYQAWTPHDFRTFALEGLEHAAFVVEREVPRDIQENGPVSGVRQHTLGDLTVNVVEGEGRFDRA